ncbi:hypothetical protein HK100_007154 [Physocladia obscura]|uniref:Beta-xylosidase C-terminal Concanavalin A-like domain-containing protein n=1 Tax=Physocladia obscura TaxID=109957 RepID=A0AAD5T6L5_9FUNG|nr:hypothetical protein HK100_007154 [Physocladia obscura]
MTEINPIVPGFSPDPSIALIDGTYYLVNSTFHMFPGLPIYSSSDLVAWKHIGNAICRQSQLSLASASTEIIPLDGGSHFLSTGGLFAPTIRHHKGTNTTYIVCTKVVHGATAANFIVSTKTIHTGGPWTDPVYFDFPGIDPSLFFDDDDNGSKKAYLHGSAGPGPWTVIRMFEINADTGETLTDVRELWKGTGGIYPEGPHIYKKDGWYYLFISEGGTHEDHMVTVARSRSIWGPYDPFSSGNPVLTARGTDEYIQHVGHTDLVEDLHGNWWAVCLGARRNGERYVLGRETFLTTLDWEDGWPVFQKVRLNPVLHRDVEKSLAAAARENGSHRVVDEVSPDVGFLYIRDAVLSNHRFSDDFKIITLVAGRGGFSQLEEPVTFVGKRQRRLQGSTSVSISVFPVAVQTQLAAGLAYFKDEHRYIQLFYNFLSSQVVFKVVNKVKVISKVVSHFVEIQAKVHLRIDYTESEYVFSFRADQDTNSTAFEAVDSLNMTGNDFVGPIIGVFAISDEDLLVQFSNLIVD